LNGEDKAERLSPATQPGTHSYQLSPGSNWTFHTYSTFETPPVVSLIKLPKHNVVRVLESNDKARKNVEGLNRKPAEFFRVKIEDGVELDAWAIFPPDFDASKKYPLFFFVYGEPAGQTVEDSWSKTGYLWHLMLAQQGYIVMSVDNRGTPGPRGAAPGAKASTGKSASSPPRIRLPPPAQLSRLSPTSMAGALVSGAGAAEAR